VRVSICVSLTAAELITRAAEHAGTSEPLFIVGATLGHIGRLQKHFRGAHAETSEEAEAICAELDRIELPAHYRYARRARRS
jgi:hypothetical protein